MILVVSIGVIFIVSICDKALLTVLHPPVKSNVTIQVFFLVGCSELTQKFGSQAPRRDDQLVMFVVLLAEPDGHNQAILVGCQERCVLNSYQLS